MNNAENEIKILEKIADIIDEANLSITTQVGLLELLKQSIIYVAIPKKD